MANARGERVRFSFVLLCVCVCVSLGATSRYAAVLLTQTHTHSTKTMRRPRNSTGNVGKSRAASIPPSALYVHTTHITDTHTHTNARTPVTPAPHIRYRKHTGTFSCIDQPVMMSNHPPEHPELNTTNTFNSRIVVLVLALGVWVVWVLNSKFGTPYNVFCLLRMMAEGERAFRRFVCIE